MKKIGKTAKRKKKKVNIFEYVFLLFKMYLKLYLLYLYILLKTWYLRAVDKNTFCVFFHSQYLF